MAHIIDNRSDTELISATTAGDADAFGVLVRRHQRAAIRVAAMQLGSATDADDVVQEAFMKAHGALGRFRDGAPFQPWLFRIVTNTARNRMRGQGRHRALGVRAARLAVVGAPTVDELAAHGADHARMVAAINRLRPPDRLVLTYRWYDELSEAEIAEALGCRRGTVKSKLSRAMSRLREELEET